MHVHVLWGDARPCCSASFWEERATKSASNACLFTSPMNYPCIPMSTSWHTARTAYQFCKGREFHSQAVRFTGKLPRIDSIRSRIYVVCMVDLTDWLRVRGVLRMLSMVLKSECFVLVKRYEWVVGYRLCRSSWGDTTLPFKYLFRKFILNSVSCRLSQDEHLSYSYGNPLRSNIFRRLPFYLYFHVQE